MFHRPIAGVVVQINSKPPLGSMQQVPNHNFFKVQQLDHSTIQEMVMRLTTRTETLITRQLHEIEQLSGLGEGE
jgi:DNA-binding ferritin-like protein